MTFRRLWLGLAAALVAACGSTPDRYYTLMPEQGASIAAVPGDRVVVVGPLTVPAMLDHAQMVVHKDAQEVDVREAERWASPLKEELTAALAARLGAHLPAVTVVAYHQSAGLEGKERIVVDVSRFQLGPGEQVSLDALWILKGGTSVRRGRALVTLPASGSGYDRLAAAQGEALDRLAQDLAAALNAVAP